MTLTAVFLVVAGGGVGCDDDPARSDYAQRGYAMLSGPDLVVNSLSGPASTMPGDGFEVEVEVCNAGGDFSYSTNVEVFLSEDGVIDPMLDMPVGGAPVPDLNPGQCAQTTVYAYHSEPDGAYVLSAYVDLYDSVIEDNEDNNAFVGDQIGIGYLADLYIASITGPPSAGPGQNFDVTVRACNQGQQTAYSHVELLLSTDTDISRNDDYMAGAAPLGQLDPGACEDVTISVYPSVLDGAYFLGALIDPDDYEEEFFEDNNALAGDQIGIGYLADLYISSITGPPSASPGQNFDVTVRACNQGQQTAYSHVELLLSTDTNISRYSDYMAGAAPVNQLDPGACEDVTIPVYTGVPDGAYVLGALIDPDDYEEELFEDNNALAGDQIGIGYLADLYIASVTGPPSAGPGQNFNVTVRACNQGQQTAYSHVELLLSTDTNISRYSDYMAGAAPVNQLDPGACEDVTIPVYTGVPDGTYVLGALIDPDNYEEEFFEDNNALAGNKIGIGYLADLYIASITGPPSASPGQNFDVTVRACNQGQQTAYSHVELLLSTDTDISRYSDYMAGAAPLGQLDPGACEDVTIPVYTSVPDGAYFLAALIDPDNYEEEFLEDNNALVGDKIGIGYRADLYIASITGPPSASPGQNFDVTVRACNQGQQTAYSHVELLLSTDTNISRYSDYVAGGGPANQLDPGACEDITIPVYSSVPDGAYFLAALIDPDDYEDEFLEDNNTLVGPKVYIGYDAELIITDVDAPATARSYEGFQVSVTACNLGQAPASYAHIDLVLSSDQNIDPMNDEFIGADSFQDLDSGDCVTLSVPATMYGSDGTYILGAVVNNHQTTPEFDYTNNTFVAGTLVIGNGPDLHVAAVSGPHSASPSQNFSVDVQVCNQGTDPAGYSSVDLVLSSDDTIDTNDEVIGAAPVGMLAAGECEDVTIMAYPNSGEGSYRLGAIADGPNSEFELIEDNNASAGGLLLVGYDPDLLIEELSGPAQVIAGSNFDVTVKVCNRGQSSVMGTEVELYLSSDDNITEYDHLAGNAFVMEQLDPGMCETIVVPAYSSAPDGTYKLGGEVDRYDAWYELDESNNTYVGDSLELTPY